MAVSVNRGGIIQKPPHWHDEMNPHLLAVEDPQEADRNIGVNSHNMEGVTKAMREASEALSEYIGDRTGTGNEGETVAQRSQVFPAWRSLTSCGASTPSVFVPCHAPLPCFSRISCRSVVVVTSNDDCVLPPERFCLRVVFVCTHIYPLRHHIVIIISLCSVHFVCFLA